MSTQKQLEANQSNALKSTGPKTQAGKNRSSLNALRHGLTGHVVVLPKPDREAFEQFTAKILHSLDLQGDHELELARTYAHALWNLQRAMAIQDNLFTLGLMEEVGENLNVEHPEIHSAVSNAKTFRHDAEAFSRISLYAQRLSNQAKTLLREIENAQARRRTLQQDEIDEAIRAYRYKQMMGESFNPAENGFVFSLEQIRLASRREMLNTNARSAEYYGYDRLKYDKATLPAAA